MIIIIKNFCEFWPQEYSSDLLTLTQNFDFFTHLTFLINLKSNIYKKNYFNQKLNK